MITSLDANTMFLLRTGIGSRNATIATSPITGRPAATCLVSIAGVMLGVVQDHHDRVEPCCYDSAGGYDVVAAQGDETCCADAGGRLGTSITDGCHDPDKVST